MTTHKTTFDSEYQGLRIGLDPELGSSTEILETIHQSILAMTARLSRVFCFFFSIRLPFSAGKVADNGPADRFVNYLIEYLDCHGAENSHVLVREQPSPDSQPSWLVLVLADGDRFHSPYAGLRDSATAVWGDILGVIDARPLVSVSVWKDAFSTETPFVGNGGVMIDEQDEMRDRAFAALFERASWMARCTPKQWVPEDVGSLLRLRGRYRKPTSPDQANVEPAVE